MDYKRDSGSYLPLERAVKVIDGKWKLPIVARLQEGPQRNNELLKKIEGISQKMLTQSLRELEEAGVILREVYPQIPPRVEYSLTRLGIKLKPIILMLEQWGEDALADRKIT